MRYMLADVGRSVGVGVTEECVEGIPLHVSIFNRGIADRSLDRIRKPFEARASAKVD
jgi:hypothetical protein